jgi:hypothetical protein
MKHSRIVLGATATFLSIGGIAVAKSHKLTTITRYYCTSFPSTTHNTSCIPYLNCPFRTSGNLDPDSAIFTIGTLRYTLFTDANNNAKCVKNQVSGAGCTHTFSYKSMGG